MFRQCVKNLLEGARELKVIGEAGDDLKLFDFFTYGAQDNIVIKLFGGAQVLALGNYAPAKRTIGEMNVARAEEILNLLGLTVDNADIGGIYGRKLYFSTMNGDVYLRRMGTKPASLSGIKP